MTGRLICCGEALVDFVSTKEKGGQPLFRPVAGGAPYNSAIAAARLGLPTSFMGAVGDDWLGELLRETLRSAGVALDLLGTRKHGTPIALAKEMDGSVEYVFHGVGAETPIIEKAWLAQSLPDNTAYLLIGAVATAIDPPARHIEDLVERHQNRLIIYYDINVRPSIIDDRDDFINRMDRLCAHAHIIKLSDDDARWLYPERSLEQVANDCLGKGALLVLLTMGEKGAQVFTQNGIGAIVSPTRVEVIDTVGAGDAFNAAFIFSLSRHGATDMQTLAAMTDTQIQDALEYAVIAAALCCTRHGADAPNLSELESFISTLRTTQTG